MLLGHVVSHSNGHIAYKPLLHKVNRCLARYSPRATTTNRPTNSNRAPNELARPICAQESIFWGKNGRFWAKHPNYFGNYFGISMANNVNEVSDGFLIC